MIRTRSARLFARSRRSLPGGVNSPVRAFNAVGGVPCFVDRARGSRLVDVDGNRYIDYVMSWGPLIHGHRPQGLLRELAAVARRGTSFGMPTAREADLAGLVRRLMPSMERVRFVNSGTEASMSAVRVARAATRRDKLLKFAGCYHGHADGFLVQAGSGALTFGTPTSPGVPRGTAADTIVADYNDLDSVRRAFRAHPNRVAAVIVEPVAANMGVVPPGAGFLAGLRDLCDRHGALLVFDEVITGFRLARGGAQEVFDVRADLTCLGKIIGGGLPVGAYGGRADLMALVAPEGPVYQAGTLSGNPLAMTAGLWSLRQLTDALYRRLDRLADRLTTSLASEAARRDVPVHVNRAGSLFTLYFSRSPIDSYRAAVKTDTAAYAVFFRAMLDRGVHLPASPFEAWFLSGAHTEGDVARTARAAREAFTLVAAANRRH